jgi:hypothetical protein
MTGNIEPHIKVTSHTHSFTFVPQTQLIRLLVSTGTANVDEWGKLTLAKVPVGNQSEDIEKKSKN